MGIFSHITAAPAPTQPKGFQLSDLLPLVGGTIGGIAGAPFGGIFGAAAGGAAGSAGGEKIRQLITGENNPGEIGNQALQGGIFSGIGKGIEPLAKFLGVGSKLGSAGEQAAARSVPATAQSAASRVLSQNAPKYDSKVANTGLNMIRKVINPKVSPDLFSPDEEKALAQTVVKYFPGGSAGDLYDQMPAAARNVGSKLESALAAAKNTTTVDGLEKSVTSSLEDSLHYLPDNPAYQQAKEKVMGYLFKQAKISGETVTASDIQKMKSALGKSVIFNKSIAELTPEQQVHKLAWEALDSTLTKLAPQAKDLSVEYNILTKLPKGLQQAAGKDFNLPGSNVPVPLVKGLVEKAAYGTGKRLINVGQESTPKLQRAAQLLANGSRISGMGTKPPASGDTSMNADLSNLPGGQQGSAAPAQAGGLTKEMLGRIMLQDLASTGGKHITELKAIGDQLIQSPTKLSSTQQKGLITTKNVNDSISQIEQSFKAAGGGAGRIVGQGQNVERLLGLKPEATAYQALRQASIAPLARAISGEVGTLTDQDIARADGMLPKITDTPAEAKLKIAQLKQAVSSRQSTYQNAPLSSDDLQSLFSSLAGQ